MVKSKGEKVNGCEYKIVQLIVIVVNIGQKVIKI